LAPYEIPTLVEADLVIEALLRLRSILDLFPAFQYGGRAPLRAHRQASGGSPFWRAGAKENRTEDNLLCIFFVGSMGLSPFITSVRLFIHDLTYRAND
jgi:hypothetical protein